MRICPRSLPLSGKIKDADPALREQASWRSCRETIGSLTTAGYQFIGMDHFCPSDDELAVAQRHGVLHRNFQGYTTPGRYRSAGDGRFGDQHDWRQLRPERKELKQYYQQVAEQGNALWRGIALTRDDCLRRDVIAALICSFQLDIAAVEAQWDVDLRLISPRI